MEWLKLEIVLPLCFIALYYLYYKKFRFFVIEEKKKENIIRHK